METIFWCGIIGAIILVVLLYLVRKREKFGDIISVKEVPDILDLRQQFDDLIVYDNSPDGRLGFDKCIENCKGYCVEHGWTGSAYCFPVKEEKPKNFDGLIVQNERKLSFPNIE